MDKEKLNTIFTLFSSKYEREESEDREEPFRSNGYICATDLHAMVYIKEELCNGFVIKNEYSPDISRTIPSENLNFEINVPVDKLKSKKKEVLFVWRYTDQCPSCYGTKEVKWFFEDDFQDYEKQDTCPRCQGTGIFKQKKSFRTHKLTFKEGELIFINETGIQLKYFYKLIQLQELVGGKIILKSINEDVKKPLLFSVGEFNVILMPYYNAEIRKGRSIHIKATVNEK